MASSLPVRSAQISLSIGQVLERLQNDFSGLTPSKLRFLEDKGLITPDRTKSGYRKFSQAHVDRLRLILTLQREHYMPLKVIAEVIDDIDAGLDPIIPGESGNSVSSILAPRPLLDRAELLRRSGAPARLLSEAIGAGLIPAAEVFAEEVAVEFEAILRLSRLGLSPQHLRALRSSCERDAQLITHATRARSTHTQALESQEEAADIAALVSTVRGGVLRRLLISATQ